MNTTNWPGGIDRSSSNWTGRAQRTSDWGGNWASDSHRIPSRAWLGAIAVLTLIFVLVPWLGYGAGF